MGIDKELVGWWEARSDEQRRTLQIAASADEMPADIVRLLIDTRCPVGPVGVKWDEQPEYGWMWPRAVREFINRH